MTNKTEQEKNSLKIIYSSFICDQLPSPLSPRNGSQAQKEKLQQTPPLHYAMKATFSSFFNPQIGDWSDAPGENRRTEENLHFTRRVHEILMENGKIWKLGKLQVSVLKLCNFYMTRRWVCSTLDQNYQFPNKVTICFHKPAASYIDSATIMKFRIS